MEEINKLTSIIMEMKKTITLLKEEKDRYEKNCYIYAEELEFNKKKLIDIEKIISKKKNK